MSSISEERELRQAKVFKKWVNSHLKLRKREVTNLEDDFDDGVNLCYLYEIISGEKLRRYSEKPKSQIQRTNNLSVVLNPVNKFIKEVGIGLQYSPTQIEKGDRRQILGLLWILITKFVIPESEEDISRKKALLKWVQKVTEPYDNVDVQNFHKSWKDGLAFNALLHQFDNECMDYGALTKDDPGANCAQAFDMAEEWGITKLLDPEDIVDFERPDDKSVMMYVALLYQYMHKFLGVKLKKQADQFLLSVDSILEWLKTNVEKYSESEFDTDLEASKELLNDWRDFLTVEKQKYGTYKCQLYVILAEIQRKQKKEHLKIFIPDDDHSLSNVQELWLKLNTALQTYGIALRDHIHKCEEEERRKREAEEQERLSEYEKFAGENVMWLYQTQKELCQMIEHIDEESDIPPEEITTDEETLNKRKAAVDECDTKFAEVYEKLEELGDLGERSSVPKKELDLAVRTFKFALEGTEDESLEEIKNFKLE